jgi:hypothetical protein
MYNYQPIRRALVSVAITVASAVLMLVPTSVAHAEQAPLVCVGSSTSTYEPGLTTSQQQVKIMQKGATGLCVLGENEKGEEIRSGTGKLEAIGILSCLSGSAVGTRTFYWATGESSVEQVRLTIGLRPEGQSVLLTEGLITKGLFQGATTHTQAVLANDDLLACHSEEGLTSTSGPRVMEFVGE